MAKRFDPKEAWNEFAGSGTVGAYLTYRAVAARLRREQAGDGDGAFDRDGHRDPHRGL